MRIEQRQRARGQLSTQLVQLRAGVEGPLEEVVERVLEAVLQALPLCDQEHTQKVC